MLQMRTCRYKSVSVGLVRFAMNNLKRGAKGFAVFEMLNIAVLVKAVLVSQCKVVPAALRGGAVAGAQCVVI